MEKKVISIKNVPADLLKKAQILAAQQDRSLSLVIRDLLREWVARQEKQQAK
jgi:predicted transcriptional regulator